MDRKYFLFPSVAFVHHVLFSSNFGNNDEHDFRIVSGILRLSTKYLIDSLRAKALAHLSIGWPCDLKAWDAREDLARSYDAEGTSTGSLRYPHPFVSAYLTSIRPHIDLITVYSPSLTSLAK